MADSADLTTLAAVRQALELPATDITRDSLISELITTYSYAIIDEVDREFAPISGTSGVPVARRFRMNYGEFRLDMAPYDLQTCTSVVLHPESDAPVTLIPVNQYQFQPVNAPQGVYTSLQLSQLMVGLYTSYTAISFGYLLIDVYGIWGFPTIPQAVQQACIIAVSSAMRRDLAGFDMAYEDGTPSSMRPDSVGTFGLPPASRRLLAPYRRAVGF